jgi:hypothetical protein
MKKLLLLSLSLISFAAANAQVVCVPTAKTVAGANSYLLPDSATGIAHACAGLAYDETLYIKAFKDTTLFGITAKTDSLTINLENATIGLPAYINVASVPAARPANSLHNYKHICIKGDSIACVRLTGTIPAGTPAGTTPLSIPFSVKAKIFVFIDTTFNTSYDNYNFVIDAPGVGVCAVGVSGIYKNIAKIEAIPNPAFDIMNINIGASKNENVTITICNAFGEIINTRNMNLTPGNNSYAVNVKDLAIGIYTYTVSNGESKITKKFSKQ